MTPDMVARFEHFTAEPRSPTDIIAEGLRIASEATREVCALICDDYASENEAAAIRRGTAPGRKRAAIDEGRAALWAGYHMAQELAATIRGRRFCSSSAE